MEKSIIVTCHTQKNLVIYNVHMTPAPSSVPQSSLNHIAGQSRRDFSVPEHFTLSMENLSGTGSNWDFIVAFPYNIHNHYTLLLLNNNNNRINY